MPAIEVPDLAQEPAGNERVVFTRHNHRTARCHGSPPAKPCPGTPPPGWFPTGRRRLLPDARSSKSSPFWFCGFRARGSAPAFHRYPKLWIMTIIPSRRLSEAGFGFTRSGPCGLGIIGAQLRGHLALRRSLCVIKWAGLSTRRKASDEHLCMSFLQIIRRLPGRDGCVHRSITSRGLCRGHD
jgi:hypothetical protein